MALGGLDLYLGCSVYCFSFCWPVDALPFFGEAKRLVDRLIGALGPLEGQQSLFTGRTPVRLA
jgi:hypothetical protein